MIFLYHKNSNFTAIINAGLLSIADDIPCNRNVGLSDERYFKAGDTEGFSKKLKEFIDKPLTEEEEKRTQIQGIADHYNWENIASTILKVYKNVLNLSQSPS
jgi:glycosyltransferase involved in cell wall biosynthesis